MNADIPQAEAVSVSDAAVAEIRRFNDVVKRGAAERPSAATPQEMRMMQRAGEGGFFPQPRLPQAQVRTVPSREDGREIPIRILKPDGPAIGVYQHIHGGGFVRGAADLQDIRLWEVAGTTGLCAVSVDYRLAPEHPYPATQDDCEDVALWLLERGPAELGVPPRFAIGGESAGAQLSVSTLLRLRDRDGIRGAFAAANLMFGGYDLSGTPSMLKALKAGHGDLSVLDSYLPGKTLEEKRDPDISPLYADLHLMPPALFTVGALDFVLDDSLFMAARWAAAGNRAELRVWPEALHGFTSPPKPCAIGRAARLTMQAFLTKEAGAAAEGW